MVVTDHIEAISLSKRLLQKQLVSDLKQTSSNQYRCFLALVAMDNAETFQNMKMVVAESVGFRFEADLFKSVAINIGFGCHGNS